MFNKETKKDPDDFWHDYEEKTGEKVLARSLGQYISGWREFDSQGWTGFWGLIIATSGGFRFHNFPKVSWLSSLSQTTSHEMQKEKIFFIPKEKIISVVLIKETKWWKKIFARYVPKLIIKYQDESENEQQLLLETEFNSDDVAEKLLTMLHV